MALNLRFFLNEMGIITVPGPQSYFQNYLREHFPWKESYDQPRQHIK